MKQAIKLYRNNVIAQLKSFFLDRMPSTMAPEAILQQLDRMLPSDSTHNTVMCHSKSTIFSDFLHTLHNSESLPPIEIIFRFFSKQVTDDNNHFDNKIKIITILIEMGITDSALFSKFCDAFYTAELFAGLKILYNKDKNFCSELNVSYLLADAAHAEETAQDLVNRIPPYTKTITQTDFDSLMLNPPEDLNFRRCNLTQIDISKIPPNLESLDLSLADISGLDFSKFSQIRGWKLNGTRCIGTNFSNLNFYSSQLNYILLKNTQFSNGLFYNTTCHYPQQIENVEITGLQDLTDAFMDARTFCTLSFSIQIKDVFFKGNAITGHFLQFSRSFGSHHIKIFTQDSRIPLKQTADIYCQSIILDGTNSQKIYFSDPSSPYPIHLHYRPIEKILEIERNSSDIVAKINSSKSTLAEARLMLPSNVFFTSSKTLHFRFFKQMNNVNEDNMLHDLHFEFR